MKQTEQENLVMPTDSAQIAFVGFGIPCIAVQTANKLRSIPHIGKLLVQVFNSRIYLLGLIYAIITRHQCRPTVKILSSKQYLKTDLFSLLVGNQPVLGNRFHVFPHAKNNDGFIDTFVIKDINNPLRFFKTVLGTFTGRHINGEDVTILRGKEFLINASEPVAFFGDGEVCLSDRFFHVEVLPRKINLITPELEISNV